MNNLVRCCLSAILISCAACGKQELVQNNSEVVKATTVVESVPDNQGLITVSSSYDVTETSDRLESIIKEKGLTLFTLIDHSANAEQAGVELKPTQLLIFGNPKVGTPLMNCSGTTAIDLPQKMLVLQDDNNQTQVIYNSPQYLQQRHNIEGCDEVLNKVSGVLKSIAETATK